MQTAVPEVMDISQESQKTLDQYGAKVGGASLANNCLLARRLVESGVRFVQLFDWGWDFHGTGKQEGLTEGLTNKCATMDKPIAALIKDLKQRDMLKDTLVVGEENLVGPHSGKDARQRVLCWGVITILTCFRCGWRGAA